MTMVIVLSAIGVILVIAAVGIPLYALWVVLGTEQELWR